MQSAGSYFETPGHDCFLYRYYTPGQATYAPYSVLPIVVMAPSPGSLYQVLPVRQPLTQHMEWWKNPQNVFQGVSFEEKQPHSVILWTDASLLGSGAHMNNCQAAGTWSSQQRSNHINWMEMKAIQLALLYFQEMLGGGLQDFAEVRQLDSSRIYQKTGGGGRSPFSCAV